MGGQRETTGQDCPYCGSDYSVTLAGAIRVGHVWRDERECLTCGQRFRRLIMPSP